MKPSVGWRRAAWWAALVLAAMGTLPPHLGEAQTGTYIDSQWVYDWAYQGRYVLYRASCVRGGRYQIEVVPETRADDPDLFVGTRSPRGTDSSRCSPWNYLWSSKKGTGYTERITFTAGYSGRHYFCVYGYRPNWVGWYVRVRRIG